jgi:hypothetical protein
MKIAPFPIPVLVSLVLWEAFELSLSLRDVFTGKGRLGRDQGSKFFIGIGLYAGLFLGAVLGKVGFSFAGAHSLGL